MVLWLRLYGGRFIDRQLLCLVALYLTLSLSLYLSLSFNDSLHCSVLFSWGALILASAREFLLMLCIECILLEGVLYL